MILPIFLFSFFTATSAQSLFDLKSFPGNQEQKIDATGPYSIYVSASSDDDALLKKVTVKSSDGQHMTLFDLKKNRNYQTSGLLEPFKVKDSAVVSSSLSDADMGTLKGFMYVTSSQQVNDASLSVYNVMMSEKVSSSVLNTDNTIVFLNSNFAATQPWQSSTISAWTQGSDSSVYIYEGVPKDTAEKQYSHIFSNPMLLPNKQQMFMPVVEVFSLRLGAFYMRVHKSASFVIEPKYYNVDQTHITSKVSTGFFMKPIATADQKVTIFTDHKNTGTTGLNFIGNGPSTLSVSAPTNWLLNVTSEIQGCSVKTIADSLILETVNSVAAEMFVQYYVIESDPNAPSTTILPGRQTTARQMETTTKMSSSFQVLTAFLIPVLGARLF